MKKEKKKINIGCRVATEDKLRKQKWSKKSVYRGRYTVWVGFGRKNKKKEEWGRMVRKSPEGLGKEPQSCLCSECM